MSLVQSKGIVAQAVISHQVDLKITYKEDMDVLMQMITHGEVLYKD